MATTTKTRPAHPAPVRAARSTSLLQAIRNRRANRSDLAYAISAYPATRSAATYALPATRPAHLSGTLSQD